MLEEAFLFFFVNVLSFSMNKKYSFLLLFLCVVAVISVMKYYKKHFFVFVREISFLFLAFRFSARDIRV